MFFSFINFRFFSLTVIYSGQAYLSRHSVFVFKQYIYHRVTAWIMESYEIKLCAVRQDSKYVGFNDGFSYQGGSFFETWHRAHNLFSDKNLSNI